MQLMDSKLPKGCYHIKAESQYEVCSTVMRIQEFYESSLKGIRGKYFTVELYMDSYAKQEGNFTYFSDFLGFNLYDKHIRKFYDMFPNNLLLEKEKEFKKLIAPILKERKKFCLIITYHATTLNFTTFAHELAHAMYYLIPAYRREMGKLVDSIPEEKREKIYEYFKSNVGYAKRVWKDEFQAYFSTGTFADLEGRGSNLLKPIGRRKTKEFHKIFKKYRDEL